MVVSSFNFCFLSRDVPCMPCKVSNFLFGPIVDKVASLVSIMCLACSSLFHVPHVVIKGLVEVTVWQLSLVCGEGKDQVSIGGGKSGISLRGRTPKSGLSLCKATS